MAKDRESITLNGKPAFYACIFDDLKKAALDCGWALGLHGSLANDMDILIDCGKRARRCKTWLNEGCFQNQLLIQMLF